MSMNHVESTQVRAQSKVVALLVALLVVMVGVASPSPAFAAEAWPGSQHQWLLDDGSKITFGAIAPPKGAPNGNPVYCIDLAKTQPGPDDVVSVATLSESKMWGPDELDLTTPQIAWLLAKYQNMRDTSTQVQLSYLIHANLEDTSPDRGGAWKDSQGAVDWMVARMKATEPLIHEQAAAKAAEARSSAAVGYEKGQGGQSGAREGVVEGIGITNAAGEFVAGRDMTVTMSGPAVFTDTGTQTWKGTSQATPLTLGWRATGNGEVTFETTFNRSVAELAYLANPNTQNTIQYPSAKDPEFITVPGNTWKVIYNFQPQGSSQVVSAEVSDGVVRDTFTTSVDPDYGSGQWLEVDGKPVTVQYRATAYYVGSEKPAQADTVPVDAQELGSVLVPATGVDQKLEASFDLPKRGWVTWVWEVRKADQGESADFVHTDWADGFGLDNETSRENLPFRPMGVSNVDTAKVIDAGGELTDTFTPSADQRFYDGVWTRLGEGSFDKGEFVPVTYRASVYFVSATELPDEAEAAPANAELVKTMTVVATEPDMPISANAGQAPKEGFYTWVWEVKADDQPAEFAKWIDSGWIDGYGIGEETTSKRYVAQIDSALSVRESKSGTYLVDDVWVTGMPSNHPNFKGGAGFKADVTEIKHEVLFFPAGVDPVEANRGRAEKIGNTVTIPAKNGFYPSIGDTSWIAKTGEDGTLVPGTYVFVSTFAGDDRVAPLTTSVEDVSEQFTVTPKPSIHTTLMYSSTRGAVPAGKVELVDQVSYTNLVPGKEYTLTGTIMVKATGKPLADAEGKLVKTTAKFTPEKPNGTQDVVFTADLTGYAGEEIVAFETLYEGDVELVVHADINDTKQTLKVTKLSTSATDQADGDKVMEKKGTQTIVDKVCEHSGQLIPGTKYTITTSLMQENGGPVLDKDGQPVTTTSTFIPSTTDECASVEISFDASLVQGSKVVVFEDVYADDVLIGVHHDLEDTAQTMTFQDADRGSASRGLAFTGASVGVLGVISLLALGVGAVLMRKRSQA